MISAKIVADSVANNIRLTTMELHYPRFIHSEFMTHRLFSRNSSSSRAIPVEKMLKQVQDTPALPVYWGKNQPGMQARIECEEDVLENSHYEFGGELYSREEWWTEASKDMIYRAKKLSEIGYHKQIVNRLLEPFQWIKVIVTATEWDNFFALRLHEDAQPEMYELAGCMKEAMQLSEPTPLVAGEWHLPYIQHKEYPELYPEKAIKCSIARCARVSYLNHDNSSPNIEKDIALHDRLLASGHFSPFEHIATPMQDSVSGQHYSVSNWGRGVTHMDRQFNLWSGNFRGFLQYRQML